MKTSYSIFKSRTFWTIVVMFIVTGGNAIVPMLPPGIQVIVTAILGIMAAHYHTNPSQQYNPLAKE